MSVVHRESPHKISNIIVRLEDLYPHSDWDSKNLLVEQKSNFVGENCAPRPPWITLRSMSWVIDVKCSSMSNWRTVTGHWKHWFQIIIWHICSRFLNGINEMFSIAWWNVPCSSRLVSGSKILSDVESWWNYIPSAFHVAGIFWGSWLQMQDLCSRSQLRHFIDIVVQKMVAEKEMQAWKIVSTVGNDSLQTLAKTEWVLKQKCISRSGWDGAFWSFATISPSSLQIISGSGLRRWRLSVYTKGHPRRKRYNLQWTHVDLTNNWVSKGFFVSLPRHCLPYFIQ